MHRHTSSARACCRSRVGSDGSTGSGGYVVDEKAVDQIDYYLVGGGVGTRPQMLRNLRNIGY